MMGQSFDNYPGFQQTPGMPILLQHSVPWGHILNQFLSIQTERLLNSKYDFSLSIPHCASLPLTNLDEAMIEIPKSRKDLFSHHLRI